MPKSTTPKAILDALFPEPVTIAGLKLQKVSALHYLALEKIQSPLVGDGPEPTSEDLLEALLILSSTPPQVRDLLALGVDGIATLARDLAARLEVGDLLRMVPQLTAHVVAAFATAVPTAAPDGEVRPLAPGSSSAPSTPSAPPTPA
jgi:hypothetical protein